MNESINIKNAQYLNNLSDDYFINHIFNKDEINEDGNKYDTLTYIKNVKLWLNKIIDSKGTLKSSYKYSSILKDHGRQYVKKFGIQSLQADIRGFLCSDKYNDFDMINAHPTILNYINNKILKDKIDTPYLLKYINNRKEILSKWKITKQQVLIIMNTEKEYKGINKYLKGLDNEFKILQNKLINCNEEYFLKICRSKNKKGNLKGTFLNRVLCCIENDILNLAVSKIGNDNIGALMFDGLFIKKEFNDFDIIEKLNDISKEYEIKWIQKAHSIKIKIDPDMILPVYENNYTKMKREFEEKNFRIEQPLLFGIESKNKDGKENFYLHSKNDFIHFCDEYEYINEKNDESTSFFKTWSKDRTKRTYKNLVFDPSTTENIDNQYNIFKGFNFIKKIEDDEYEEEGVNLFLNHLKLLCNHEEEATQYLIQYIADIFQNPQNLPGIAIVMIGDQGTGKDIVVEFIQNIIGKEYLTKTANFNSLFGTFNCALKNKLVIRINEVSGKDGYGQKEKLKDLITESDIIINEKGLKQYTLKNYARLIMYSNSENPIEIPTDNRRYWVVKTADKMNDDYYIKIRKNMINSKVLHSIYSYFMNLDISKFNIRKFPVTKKMKIMEEHNINPIYYYLHDTFENSKEENIFISSKKIFGDILYYFENEGYPTTNITARSIKTFLCNIKKNPIECKPKTINKKTHRGFNINTKKLLEIIKPLVSTK